MTPLLALTSTVLRDPRALLDAHDDPKRYAELVPALLVLTAASAAVFGATVGSYRGGLQVAYAGLKTPFLLLLPLVLALPAVHAWWANQGAPTPAGRLALVGLVAAARTAMLAAAASPAIWLLYSLTPDYHVAVLVLAATLVGASIPGLWVYALAFPGTGLRRATALTVTVGLIGALTAQTGWLLRPFVARPTAEVTLLRAVEADVFDAIDSSAAAATGRYEDWEVQPAGALGGLTGGER